MSRDIFYPCTVLNISIEATTESKHKNWSTSRDCFDMYIKIFCSQCFLDKHKRIQSATQIPIKYLKYLYRLFSTMAMFTYFWYFNPIFVADCTKTNLSSSNCYIIFFYVNYIFHVLKKKNRYYVKWMWCTVLLKMHSSGNEERQ